jgi:hypothetical protein
VSAPPAVSAKVFVKVNSILGMLSSVVTRGVFVTGVIVTTVLVVSAAEIMLISFY